MKNFKTLIVHFGTLGGKNFVFLTKLLNLVRVKV